MVAITIFTMTHKKYHRPADTIYVPLHVGHATAADLGYPGDDTGDNISEKNCYYSELTGVYWIWKNFKTDDYVGVCHYRRYLMNEQGGLFNEADYRRVFESCDIITSKRLQYDYTYYEGYREAHNIRDLIVTGEVIRELFPDYYEDFERMVHERSAYFGNIMVTTKPLFDEYASWLFTIFFEVEKRIDVSSYDAYHKRVFGFISEFLLLVWVTHKGLRVYESMVGMSEEKYETREMKEKLAVYFRKREILPAKEYFMSCLKERPDVLLEASDITGELKLSMQVIATCENEQAQNRTSVIDRMTDFHELMTWFRRLNQTAQHFKNKEESMEDILFLQKEQVSEVAARIAVMLSGLPSEEENEVFLRISKALKS